MDTATQPALRVPRSATRFILYQRTELSRLGEKSLQRIERLTGPRGRHWALQLDATIRGRQVRRLYAKDIAAEMAALAPHLPSPCASVLDIGCGLATIDAALYRHLGPVRLHLVDRNVTERRIAYGFRPDAAFYNDNAAMLELLVANGVARSDIAFHDAASPIDVPSIDLVLSLLSWGFHYPIDTYLDLVADRLAPHGRVIVDVRKGTGDIDALRDRFAVVEPIIDDAKRVRVVAYR